ncbi:polysaccharide pyruvyl transferase family protein [Microbacterium sp. gxy059]|uniref:polysaccharide pyruvyl transferase family protein n=1 Tax=Microbacterium sp. gxy059 TaxID=2957199 RepID=UPI003D99D795
MLEGVELPRWHPDDDGGNFGDELGPMLVRAIREQATEEPSPSPGPGAGRLISIGSVLHFARPGDVVWGAGVNGKVRQVLTYPLDVRAVRGPYTRAVLLGHGIDVPEVYGDPALLLPDLVPELAKARGVGNRAHRDEVLVPNLNDRALLDAGDVVDPRGDPRSVIRRILGASFVIASSLHALIVADAFGIPSRPLLSASEHPFKYVDYYAGTGRRGVRFASSPAEARDLGPVEPTEIDREALLSAFPHDVWGGESSRGPDRDQAGLRRASATALEDIARGLEYRETAEEARALTRAAGLIGDQDALALRVCDDANGGPGATAHAARSLYWFLRKGAVRNELDARVMTAVSQAQRGGEQPPTWRDEVLWRLVGAQEIVLARAVARENAEIGEGIARARALGLIGPADDEERAATRPALSASREA